MAERAVRTVERRRWQNGIVRVLERFPNQYAALEHAMGSFGDDFDLQAFKRAFEFADGMDAYNRAQAVERAVGRVQNFIADLAELGAKLVQLPAPRERGSAAERAFFSLRDAGVIDDELCGRLRDAQRARTRIEHFYLDVTAGEVHRAARLVRDIAPRFLDRYVDWIEPYLPA
jgi:uncharacterized protein YutE (UPF0331/DUF86 family)